jgi:hypothetical protein
MSSKSGDGGQISPRPMLVFALAKCPTCGLSTLILPNLSDWSTTWWCPREKQVSQILNTSLASVSLRPLPKPQDQEEDTTSFDTLKELVEMGAKYRTAIGLPLHLPLISEGREDISSLHLPFITLEINTDGTTKVFH